MKLRSTWIIAVVVIAAAGIGARVWMKRAQSSPVAATTKTQTPAGTALELAASDLARAAVVDLSRTVEASGSIKAANSAYVKARVAGELRSLTVREGDPVRAGQTIGQIDTTEYELRVRQAQQQAQANRAQLDIAQRALKNNKALVDQGFISPTALETSAANEAAAQATYNASTTAVSLAVKSRSDATLVAPIAGVVSQRLAQPGERVSIEARIVEVVDLSRMEMEAAMAPQDAAQLRMGQKASLKVEGVEAPVAATVARISPSAQAGSRAVLVYFALAANPALRQGLFARGTVAIEERKTLAIPATAVRNDQALPTIPVLVNGAVVNKVVALGSTGEWRGEPYVEVRSGLAEGDQYLSGMVGVVRDATTVRLPQSAAAPTTASAASQAAR